jgi:hypothetical protein
MLKVRTKKKTGHEKCVQLHVPWVWNNNFELLIKSTSRCDCFNSACVLVCLLDSILGFEKYSNGKKIETTSYTQDCQKKGRAWRHDGLLGQENAKHKPQNTGTRPQYSTPKNRNCSNKIVVMHDGWIFFSNRKGRVRCSFEYEGASCRGATAVLRQAVLIAVLLAASR